MREILYLDQAQEDLRAIALYIAEDNPDRAIRFIEELRATALKTAERPASFPARPNLAPGLRVARHQRYLIFFTYDADRIEIVRILHGARDLDRLFSDT